MSPRPRSSTSTSHRTACAGRSSRRCWTPARPCATYILWALTGRRFTGLRSRTVRVLAPPCSCGGMSRVGLDTSGFLTGLRRMGGCVCQVELRLPDEDAREVLSVDVYGVRLDATA